MSVTYDHHADPEHNPASLSLCCIERVNRALTAAAYAAPAPDTNAESLIRGVDIMGYRLAPSPELHGGGAGVLDVDYADGETRTFDVASDGHLTPRRYALACALVIETDVHVTPGDGDARSTEWLDTALTWLGNALPPGFPGEVVFCSTPERRPLSRDGYDVLPENDER